MSLLTKIPGRGKHGNQGRKPKRGKTDTYTARLVVDDVDNAIKKSGLTFSPLVEKLIKDYIAD